MSSQDNFDLSCQNQLQSHMVKSEYNPARRLTHITHARKYLKNELQRGGEVSPQVKETFRKFYRRNDRKLQLLLLESTKLTVGCRRDTYNSRSFFINGESISTELTSTPEGVVAAALRLTEYETRPAEFKNKPGLEMHHANEGGFDAIKKQFVDTHGTDAILKAIQCDQLTGELRNAFISFHAEHTDNYKLCQMLTEEEHCRITRINSQN